MSVCSRNLDTSEHFVLYAGQNPGVEVQCSGGNGGKQHACAALQTRGVSSFAHGHSDTIACCGAGAVCNGPACQLDALLQPIDEGLNVLKVAIKPKVLGQATTTRIRLKVEDVEDSFSQCEDNVILFIFQILYLGPLGPWACLG